MTPALKAELERISGWTTPKHDILEWLLGKLPHVIQEDGKFLALVIYFQGDGTFHMTYAEPYDKEFRGSYITNASILIEAVAKLTIKLFQQNILTKEQV